MTAHLKVKKGDTVFVRTGKDRGKTGKVLRVAARENRLLVEGIALQTRHRRARRANEKGQRVTMPAFISAANVQVICGACGKPTRVGYRVTEDSKQRYCKKCEATIS